MNSFNKKCPFCGQQNFKQLYVANHFPIVKCRECQLIFTQFSKGLENDEEKRQNVYKSKSYKANYLSLEVVRRMTERSKRRLKELETYLGKKGKILDLGCSYGYFLKTASDLGWNVWGVDINKEAIDYLKRDLNSQVAWGTIFDIKFPEKFFDAITAWDVLEHLPDLESVLKKMEELLKDKGVLAIQVPNGESLTAKISRGKWPWLSPPDHLYHFSPKSLSNFLEKFGFKILKLKTWINYKDFVNNLLSIFYTGKQGLIFAYWNTLIFRSVQIFSPIFSFLIIPFVFLISKFLLGDLIVVYATKK